MAERLDEENPLCQDRWKLRWAKGLLPIPVLIRSPWKEALFRRYQACQRYVRGRSVLDIPCGTGWGTSLLKGASSCIGIDNSEDAVVKAKTRYPGSGDYIVGDMASIPLGAGTVDVVVCMEGIEHVDLSVGRAALNEFSRVIRCGGRLLITTPVPDRNGPENPFHVHEYTLAELTEQIERAGFSVEDVDRWDGPGAGTYFIVGRKERSSPAPQDAWPERPIKGSDQGGDVRAHAIPSLLPEFIQACGSPTGFRFTVSGECTLMSTCFGLLAGELTGQLADLTGPSDTPSGRVASAQDDSGHWRDPVLRESELTSLQTLDYVQWQTSYFALHALDAVGEKPRHELAFVEPFLDPGRAVQWLHERDFDNFWYSSNEIMWLMSFLAFEEREGNARAANSLDAMLDELDRLQDPETGYWGTDKGSNLFQGMAGAFHVYYFYFWRGRPIAYADRVIDSTLSLQHRDGLFNAAGGGGSCHDLDAVDILVKFGMVTDHRRRDVRRALDRAYDALWTTQNADGGFCERCWPPKPSWKRRVVQMLRLDGLLGKERPEEPPVYRYSGWTEMECLVNESNVWASWFRPLALALISVRYPGEYLRPDIWTFRGLPGLGWHDPERIQASAERL